MEFIKVHKIYIFTNCRFIFYAIYILGKLYVTLYVTQELQKFEKAATTGFKGFSEK